MKKQSPKLESMKKKLSKIGPTENFHLSQKSKSIVKDSKSLLKSTKANVAKKR